MDNLKQVGLYVTSSLFRFVVFFGVSLICLSLIITNPKQIKSQLKESGAYENFVHGVIEDTVRTQPNATLPFKDPKIQQIISDSFPSSSLQTNAEAVIDGFYNWLSGKTTKPNFSVDFTKERQQLADNISAYAFTRLKSQPTCFAIPEQIDLFTAGCVPPYSDINAEQAKFSQSIAGPEGLLPHATYTSKDLPKDVNGNYIYEKYSYAPKLYTWLRYTLPIVSVALLLLAAAIVLLNRSKRRGFQQLGAACIGSGIALVITPIIISYVIPHFSKTLAFDSSSSSSAQAVINNAVTSISTNFNVMLINGAIQIIGLGLIILAAEKISRPTTKYADLAKRAGLISSDGKKPSSARKYKPETIPVQSSEESVRRKPKRTKNKKYRKIPKKEI